MGVCELFSETGTEGGYWAFQDSKFIKKVDRKSATQFSCAKCYCAYVKRNGLNIRISRIIPLDKALQPGFKTPKSCRGDQHDFQPISEEEWSYDGLHVLKDGDWLTIYDKEKPGQIVWEGVISLKPRKTIHEFVRGWRVHSIPLNADKEKWLTYFLKNYPAKLIQLKKK